MTEALPAHELDSKKIKPGLEIGSMVLLVLQWKTPILEKDGPTGEIHPRKCQFGVPLTFWTTDNVSGRYRSVRKFNRAKPTHVGAS